MERLGARPLGRFARPRRRFRAGLVQLLCAVAGLALGLVSLLHWRPGQLVTVARVPWIPQLGISYYLAADGISLTLVLLASLCCHKIHSRVRDQCGGTAS